MPIADDVRNLFREFGGHAESYVEFENTVPRARGATIEAAFSPRGPVVPGSGLPPSRGGLPDGPGDGAPRGLGRAPE